ncbi:SLC13 family permease [Candidatus Kuenenia sp.]|uniref:SLC13 family permease n=1 Tax=Candidatus Kuenenia sp. TaxID=2499824 RepID=UPI00322056AA
MNTKLLILFIVLTATLILFVWNRWRYDIVALVALLIVAIAGLVPPDQVFAGFGHPAVITVAAVLVLSRGLLNAGVVDSLARQLTRVGNHPMIQVATLTGIVSLCSGFMNNVGALALLMPVAIWMSRRGGRSPSFLLMPLAFGSLFGGTLTLIGTPPNIIIAAYREQSGALPFGMFDFIPVGAAITICGLFFISIIGWRLTPQRKEQDSAADLFEISSYLTELLVPEGCKFAGRTLYDLIAAVRNDADVVVIGLVRTGRRQQMPSTYEVIKENDILQVEADSDSLKTLIDVTGLKLSEAGGNADKGKASEGELNLVEATVTPGSMLAGRTATSLDLRERYGINVLAVARQGRRLRERLGKIRFVTGDILLIQGREESLPSALNDLGCLPLASRGLRIGKPRNVLLAICIFAVTLALIACKLLPAATALAGGAAVMVLAGLISPSEIYKSIDMSVILLLAAMLPIGQALESTGGSQLIAYKLLAVGRSASPAMTLVILVTATMLLSNLVNNAAAAILAAPIAVNLAKGMELSSDPFLMAVAIGSSCAFLTPIGHQSNTLVMAPGGYKFGDYWRMGLPLSVLVVATAVPVILWIWPL